MRTVSVTKRAKALSDLLTRAAAEDLIVRAPDGTEFLLTMIDDFEGEVARTRRNKKLMAFLDTRGKQTDTISWAEVQHRLSLTRPKRKTATSNANSRRGTKAS